MKVYCYAMDTSTPKEFITLPAGVEKSYAYNYARRLRSLTDLTLRDTNVRESLEPRTSPKQD